MDEKKLELLSPKTILIVEDDDGIGDFLTLVINEETPYLAMLVKDGFQALRRVKTKMPDLIILDYRLPGMNGIQFYERLCTCKELADTPVVMISADIPTCEVRKHRLILVHKPFDLDELLSIIDRLISQPVKIANYRAGGVKWA